MDAAETLIGRQFANFRILRLLGRGGMAEVYYGWDVKLERPVAIKMIDARYRDNPLYAQRFVNEARAMAAWHHPNIIPIYYADDEGGYYYYVMEYVQGLDLEQLLSTYAQRKELMPLEDVIRIGRAAAEALDYAHSHGVIHRDVKPSNLLISADGRVLLTDFGIAHHLQRESLGSVFGSPQYMAPEQARSSSEVAAQADLYSLGVILYEMLTGALPFDDPSPTTLAIQHLTLEPPPPRQVNPRLSEAVEQVLVKALRKQPELRYATGKELLDALEPALKLPADTISFRPLEAATADTARRPPRRVSQTSAAELLARHLEDQPALPAGAPLPEAEIEPAPRSRSIAFWGLGCGALLALGALLIFAVSLVANPSRDLAQAVAPSGTPTLRPPTFTASPVNTQTPTATVTQLPSQTPTAPASASPSPLPSATSQPSASPTPTAVIELPPPPTKRPQGDPFVMYYDQNSFYIKNLSSKDRSVYPLAFEQLDKDGKPVNRFDGWRWGTFYPTFRAGYCLVLEIINTTDHLDPPECKGLYLVIRTPTSDAGYIFWVKNKNYREFRVLWDDEEAGRCKIGAGTCEVYLP